MVKELTRQELLDEISELRQKVIELQSEIIRLRQSNNAPWQPYVYPFYEIPDDSTGNPYYEIPDDSTGNPLQKEPYTVCVMR